MESTSSSSDTSDVIWRVLLERCGVLAFSSSSDGSLELQRNLVDGERVLEAAEDLLNTLLCSGEAVADDFGLFETRGVRSVGKGVSI